MSQISCNIQIQIIHAGTNFIKREKWVCKDMFAITPLTKLSTPILQTRGSERQHRSSFLGRQPSSSSPATAPATRLSGMPVRVVDTATPSSQPSPGSPTLLAPPPSPINTLCAHKVRFVQSGLDLIGL